MACERGLGVSVEPSRGAEQDNTRARLRRLRRPVARRAHSKDRAAGITPANTVSGDRGDSPN